MKQSNGTPVKALARLCPSCGLAAAELASSGGKYVCLACGYMGSDFTKIPGKPQKERQPHD